MATEVVGSIQYDATIDTKKIKSDASKIESLAKNTGDKLGSHIADGAKYAGDSIKTFAKVTAAALVATTVAVVAFGKSSFDAYSEAEASSAQLKRAVIDVTGATEEQLKATEDLADALEKKGVLDGDNIKTGLAQLSTFGLSNKAVQGLAGSLADLAVNQYGVNASGEQLTDSANMIAKALRGEFGMLQKSGIRFTEAQIATIKFGTEMEKVAAINEGFAQNLKYTNAVAVATSSGGLAKLKVNLENVQEAFGGAIAKGINPLVQKLTDFVQTDKFQKWVTDLTNWLEVNLPIAFDYVIYTVIPALQKAFNDAQPYLQGAWDILKGIADFLSTDLGKAVGIGILTIQGLSIVFGGLVTAIGAPIIMPAIAVGAALGAIAAVMVAYNDMKTAIEGAKKAEENMLTTRGATLDKLYSVLNNSVSSPEAKARARKALDNLMGGTKTKTGLSANSVFTPNLKVGFADGGYTGYGATNDVAGLVHKGEYVLPKNMVNQSTGLPKADATSMSKNIVINQTNNVNTQVDMNVINRSLTWQLRRA